MLAAAALRLGKHADRFDEGVPRRAADNESYPLLLRRMQGQGMEVPRTRIRQAILRAQSLLHCIFML